MSTAARRARRWAAILLPFLLGACAPEAPLPPSARLSPKSADIVLPYSFRGCSAEISSLEQASIVRFLRDQAPTPQDRIVISVPKGRNPQEVRARRLAVLRLFPAQGAPLHILQDHDFRDASQRGCKGLIRLVRPQPLEVTCRRESPDLGCSTAQNLAAMIAYPEDMILPIASRRYRPSGRSQTGGAP